MNYAITFREVNLGSSPNVPTDVVCLKLANTLGHRARIRSVFIGLSQTEAIDVPMEFRFDVTDNTVDPSGGTDILGNIVKRDPLSVPSRIVLAHQAPTVRPTVRDRIAYDGAVNTRAALILSWGDFALAPVWGPNETMTLIMEPGVNAQGNRDVVVTGTLEWTEY